MEEKLVDFQKAEVGDRVVIKHLILGDDVYTAGYIHSISPNRKVITVGEYRFGEDGWMFNQTNKLDMRLLQATPELTEYVHRQELITHLSWVMWQRESTVTLELVRAALANGRAMS